MNAQQCAQGDWRAYGYQDGSNGINQLAKRTEACLDKGIQVRATDRVKDYEAGFSEGVKAYCKPSVIFQRASQGHQYTGVCPKEDDQQIMKAVQFGSRIHAIDQDSRRLQQQIDEYQRQLTSPTISGQQRQTAEAEIRNMQRRLDQNRHEARATAAAALIFQ